MSRRDGMSPEARERERAANRERMARKLADPEYRASVNTKRRARDAERKAVDPDLRARLRSNGKRHYGRRHGDPEFEAARVARHREWRHRKRIDREFEAFVERAGGDW